MMFDLDQADADFAASAHVVPVNADPDPIYRFSDNALCLPRAEAGPVMRAALFSGRAFDQSVILASQRTLCAACAA
jgi:hypothetical protein